MVKIERALRMTLPPGQSAFLWGPRKTGKTTYLRSAFPDSLTFDLLQTDLLPPDLRGMAPGEREGAWPAHAGHVRVLPLKAGGRTVAVSHTRPRWSMSMFDGLSNIGSAANNSTL